MPRPQAVNANSSRWALLRNDSDACARTTSVYAHTTREFSTFSREGSFAASSTLLIFFRDKTFMGPVFAPGFASYLRLLLLLQVRRRLKRAEAARTASRTGQLRVVLGAAGGAARDSGHDLYHPSHAGWLETDVNTLDVTDPSDLT